MYFFFSITFSCGADSSIFFKVPMICMDQHEYPLKQFYSLPSNFISKQVSCCFCYLSAYVADLFVLLRSFCPCLLLRIFSMLFLQRVQIHILWHKFGIWVSLNISLYTLSSITKLNWFCLLTVTAWLLMSENSEWIVFKYIWFAGDIFSNWLNEAFGANVHTTLEVSKYF